MGADIIRSCMRGRAKHDGLLAHGRRRIVALWRGRGRIHAGRGRWGWVSRWREGHRSWALGGLLCVLHRHDHGQGSSLRRLRRRCSSGGVARRHARRGRRGVAVGHGCGSRLGGRVHQRALARRAQLEATEAVPAHVRAPLVGGLGGFASLQERSRGAWMATHRVLVKVVSPNAWPFAAGSAASARHAARSESVAKALGLRIAVAVGVLCSR